MSDVSFHDPERPDEVGPHSSQVERALSLLVNASRVSPPLREALFTVEAHLTGVSDDLRWYRQAFHKHVDEIDRLKGLLGDLLRDCDNRGCAPDDRYSEALQ